MAAPRGPTAMERSHAASRSTGRRRAGPMGRDGTSVCRDRGSTSPRAGSGRGCTRARTGAADARRKLLLIAPSTAGEDSPVPGACRTAKTVSGEDVEAGRCAIRRSCSMNAGGGRTTWRSRCAWSTSGWASQAPRRKSYRATSLSGGRGPSRSRRDSSAGHRETQQIVDAAPQPRRGAASPLKSLPRKT